MPLLSIIVPVYNKEAYINLCIGTVLKQTLTDFELILVNDGSTDASGKICDGFAKTDARISVIHQTNQGVSAARNAGLNLAKGNYVGFVDCDDELENDMYEVLLSTIEAHRADIAICGVRKIFPDKTELFYGSNSLKIYNKTEAVRALLKKHFARSVYDKVFKTELAKKIMFEGSMNEDTFYNFLVLNEANKVVFNDVIKYNYIVRDNSASMTKFSKKYLDTIRFSSKMVEICKEKMPELVDEARYYDLVNNISLLNLILLTGKNLFMDEYKLIVNNLKSYSGYISNPLVSKKHWVAYKMFAVSPAGYGFFMKLYCSIMDADVSKKK